MSNNSIQKKPTNRFTMIKQTPSFYLDKLGTELSNKGANFEVGGIAEFDAAKLSFVGVGSWWLWIRGELNGLCFFH